MCEVLHTEYLIYFSNRSFAEYIIAILILHKKQCNAQRDSIICSRVHSEYAGW